MHLNFSSVLRDVCDIHSFQATLPVAKAVNIMILIIYLYFKKTF